MDTAIRLDSNDKTFYAIRGSTYRMKGDYIKALRDLNEAIKLDSNYAWAFDQRARVYRAQGRNDLADADTATANRLRAAGY